MLQLVCKRIRQLESIESLKKSILDSLFLNSTNCDLCFLILIQNGKMFYKKMNFEARLQRSTVYNNAATLKKYIEERIREVEEDILSIHRTAKQQEGMEFLRS